MKTFFTLLFSTVLVLVISCNKSDIKNSSNQTVQVLSKDQQSSSSLSYGGWAIGVNSLLYNNQGGTLTTTRNMFAQANTQAIGGTLKANEASVSANGAISAEGVSSETIGVGSTTTSRSLLSNLRIDLGGHIITADRLEASATSKCGAILNGTTMISNLVIDGTTRVITGNANQVIFFPAGGIVVINEQATSKKAGSASINVTALRISLPYSAEISLAAVKAEIKCSK